MSNAGWHPDPLARHQLRYFDGEQWTPHVVDDDVVSFDPLAAAPTDAAPATDADSLGGVPTKRDRRMHWLVLGAIVVVVVGVALVTVAFASSSSTKSETVDGSFTLLTGFDRQHIRQLRDRGCEGDADHRDVNPNTPVVIEGIHGDELTRTTLGPGRVAGDACVFTFTFTVEEGAPSYVVSVGRRSSSQYTFAELEQPNAVALTFDEP
jgi:uncharacterized protein DUF2510